MLTDTRAKGRSANRYYDEPNRIAEEVGGRAKAFKFVKHDNHRRKHATLTALFRTLLHQLMTAQIRVHDLGLAELTKSN